MDPVNLHGTSMSETMPTTSTVLLMLGSLDGKMNLILEGRKETQEQIDRLEGRITALEHTFGASKAWVLGAIAVVTALATLFQGALVDAAGKLIKVLMP